MHEGLGASTHHPITLWLWPPRGGRNRCQIDPERNRESGVSSDTFPNNSKDSSQKSHCGGSGIGIHEQNLLPSMVPLITIYFYTEILGNKTLSAVLQSIHYLHFPDE